MPYPTGGLREHREMLATNPMLFEQDKKRVLQYWTDTAWKYVGKTTDKKRSKVQPLLEEMAAMVWSAQGGKPLFQFDSVNGLPMSWNVPARGELDYISYEVGHHNPVNVGGDSHPNNLCYQSGRCNRHMQASLPLEEVEVFYQGVPEVLERIHNLRTLYQSDAWNSLLEQVGLGKEVMA